MVDFRLQERLVGRSDLVSENVLDHLIALIEAVFDQRVAGQSADDVKPRYLRLVGLGDDRKRGRVGAGEDNPAGFDEAARRLCADAGEDAVAGDPGHALCRLDDERAWLDLLRFGIDEVVDVAFLDRRLYQGDIPGLGAREIRDAVNDRHTIVDRQRQRVLKTRITGPNYDDFLALIGLRIVELILYERQVGARDR